LCPTRFCRKSAGPGEVSRMQRAMRSMGTEQGTRTVSAKATSKRRLARESDHELAMGLARTGAAGTGWGEDAGREGAAIDDDLEGN